MSRPTLAFVCTVLRPYRTHFLKRVARELTALELHTAVLFEHNLVPVDTAVFDPAIRPGLFGAGESVRRQGKLRHAVSAWAKGGRIAQWLERRAVAAVVCVGYSDPALVRVMRWCRRRGVACLVAGDSNILGDRQNGPLKSLAKQAALRPLLRLADGVLCNGSLGRDYFRKYGVPDGRIHLMPYEPDYGLIASLPEAFVEDVRRRHQLAPDRRRIFFGGRLVRRKRVDLLLDAFAAVAAERPAWDLVVMGQGPLEDELKARAPARTRFLPFSEDQREVSAMYRLCDVMALPSEYEAWALVVNEAVAAGAAVLSSDVVGASRELVRDGVNGRVFASGDLADCTAALREVTHPGRIDALKAASARVLADWRRSADPVRGLHEALTAAGVRTGYRDDPESPSGTDR